MINSAGVFVIEMYSDANNNGAFSWKQIHPAEAPVN